MSNPRTSSSLSRRSFLAGAAAAVSAPAIVPARVFGAGAPSKTLSVGFIGVGGHGLGHNLRAYLKEADARVTMVCDVDGQRLTRAQRTVDRHYGDTSCRVTKDFREVLDRLEKILEIQKDVINKTETGAKRSGVLPK